MLVSFSVSNFRSFAAEQTVSLVASRRLGSAHESHTMPIPDSDERVLRACVIYGANGAGKSNLLAALRYVRYVALAQRKESHTIARTPFRLGDLQDQPSTFDLRFIAADKLWRYGLSLDDERIFQERLLHVVDGRERLIYERHTDSAGNVEIEAPGLKNESEKLQALVTVGGRHNQSFLATARATLERGDLGRTLTEVTGWLDEGLTLLGPESTPELSGRRLVMDEGLRRFASDFLRASSTGVDHLRVDREEVSADEAQVLAPEAVQRMVMGSAGDGTRLLVERTADGEHFWRVAIQAVHKHAIHKERALELSEESDGTQRFLDLIPALYQQRPGRGVWFIDEIDRSLHPMLLYKYLEYFLRTCTRSPCQIIATTHESHLLDLDLLRRDEIWFAEKDAAEGTHLYSLTEFNVRKDLQVRKGYLGGRFGAVPFLGEIDQLIGTGRGKARCP